MALVQVPYNNAMRLGQGFNSYTQEICIDNAVVGISDPEDSQPVVPVPEMPVVAGGTTTTPANAETTTALTTTTKEPVTQLMSALQTNTQTYPSQIVTYYSKYVDKLSDVSSDMNISGSLSIKYGEISGGGSGSYVDVETFQNSDMNFLISVKVINQTINVKDQLQFWPLSYHTTSSGSSTPVKTPTPAEFTKIYGDSFISGFQEGGQFYAIVSIKALDSSKKTEIAASAHLALSVGVGSVEAQGDVALAKAELQKNSEVNITVNWSGGGQLKEGGEKWDIDTLTEVAVRFPDLVAACPQRTHAILTKYTALRGYLEWNASNDVLPLDYEMAQLYTSELLDVYMGYKVIWDDIHSMIQNLDSGVITLLKAPNPNPPILMPMVISADGTTWVNGPQLSCFDPDYAGLDSALQTCRSLMVRIVKEIETLTGDPAQAVNTAIPVAYLRPQLFKQLLPIQTPILLPPFSTKLTLKTLTYGGFDTNATSWDLTQSFMQNTTFSYPSGPVQPSLAFGLSHIDLNTIGLRTKILSSQVGLTQAVITDSYYPDYPAVAETVRAVIQAQQAAAAVPASNPAAAAIAAVAVSGARSALQSVTANIPHTLAYRMDIVAAAIPANDEGIQTGTYTMPWRSTSSGTAPTDFTQAITFPNTYSFNAPPSIVVFIAGFDRGSGHPTVDLPFTLQLTAQAISNTGFTLRATCTGGGDLNTYTASWLAVPTDHTGILVGNTSPMQNLTGPNVPSAQGHVGFPLGSFNASPGVYCALSGFSFSSQKEATTAPTALRLDLLPGEVTKDSFNWHATTWSGTGLQDASVGWIAVSQ